MSVLNATYRVQRATFERPTTVRRAGLLREVDGDSLTFDVSVEVQTAKYRIERPGSRVKVAVLLVADNLLSPTKGGKNADVLPGDKLTLATAVSGVSEFYVDYEDGPFKRTRQFYAVDHLEAGDERVGK